MNFLSNTWVNSHEPTGIADFLRLEQEADLPELRQPHRPTPERQAPHTRDAYPAIVRAAAISAAHDSTAAYATGPHM
ncbi:hypothetical protein C5E45_19705 [Nocardia nova]|uniref:Uncharacterized protein n=1 Tax=Nocardia nova TaxID=37330 RepID=A0A2S6AN53_9NOCA|nr:hypothetical protein C5E41_18825 [Nocardia nova]PPJ36639.1 hypothetical protein C5E45_19705 [Nocardia nova]